MKNGEIHTTSFHYKYHAQDSCLHLAHPPHPAPNQIPESELPPGCKTGFVVNIPDDIQQHAPECGETTALLSLIKDKEVSHYDEHSTVD